MILALVLALQNDASPAGEPALDPATLRCLGATWIVRGDEDRDARVAAFVRKAGAADWREGPPLLRVERGAARAPAPDGAWLFAGSVVDLEPGADYELKLVLADPDGGAAEKILKARTISEPVAPADLAVVHLKPGPGVFKEAQRNAKPGTLFLLRAGVYEGAVDLWKSGEPGRPMVWRAAGDGEVVIDAQGASNGVVAAGVWDVWLEGLTIRNCLKGITASETARLVVRRCRVRDVSYGIVGTVNETGQMRGWFIADNVFEGPSTWPRTKGIEAARGVQITGAGHVVCHNRIRGFADGVDIMPSPLAAAIDIHHNEISEMTDDGVELDFSDRNTRCFSNRLTNVFQGISAQPVHGGPAYVFRNALYNVSLEPFKLHSGPSGVLLYHNTVVKKGTPFLIATPEPVRNSATRNNLFVGSADAYGCRIEPPMKDCDFDYDGFAGGPWPLFLKWRETRYATPDEAKRKAPAYRNARILAGADLFASGAKVPDDDARAFPVGFDARLKPGTGAVDAGVPLPGFNAGPAPDLGALELGAPLPAYGPRPPK